MSVLEDQIDDAITFPDEFEGCYDMSKNCPLCGKPMKTKHGKFDKFRGCSQFPTCDYTEDFQEFGQIL